MLCRYNACKLDGLGSPLAETLARKSIHLRNFFAPWLPFYLNLYVNAWSLQTMKMVEVLDQPVKSQETKYCSPNYYLMSFSMFGVTSLRHSNTPLLYIQSQ